jgi:PAS domain-containing protein
MQKFVCEQNIIHFQKLLSEATDAHLQRALKALLSSAQRDLAMLNSASSGTDLSPLDLRRRSLIDEQAVRQQFQTEFDNAPHPYMLLDPGPGLHIIDINDAYARATFIKRDDVVGQSLFVIFPDNPDDALADGVNNLYASLRIVAQTGHAHAMAIQRYDIRLPTGEFVERHWQPVNTPIHDRNGTLALLLHHVEDVTEHVLSSRSGNTDADLKSAV